MTSPSATQDSYPYQNEPIWSRSEKVIARAAARGVAIEGLGGYALREHTRGPALVIGYATTPEHGYTTALARLVAAIRDR